MLHASAVQAKVPDRLTPRRWLRLNAFDASGSAAPLLTVQGLHKSFERQGLRRHRLPNRGGREGMHHRAERLGQNDLLRCLNLLVEPTRGPSSSSRRTGRRLARGRPTIALRRLSQPDQDGIPAIRAVPASDGAAITSRSPRGSSWRERQTRRAGARLLERSASSPWRRGIRARSRADRSSGRDRPGARDGGRS